MVVTTSIIVSFLLFISIPNISAASTTNNDPKIVDRNAREAFEIIIGGGSGSYSPPPEYQDCPPPPPPPCPPPPSPPPPCPPPPSPPPPPPPKLYPPPPPPPPPPPAFESKRLELVYPVIQAFKTKITHDPLGITKSWNGTRICQEYKGFRCDIVPGFNVKALSGVKFNNYNFSGPDLTLSGFIDSLPDIAFFHANSNNFTGAIPRNISNLKYLFELDLSNNKFCGSFPYEVLGAKQLVFLDIRFNTFSGLLPPQAFGLDVDLLFVNNNNFEQTLPDNLGSNPALYLSFANNKFVGKIPRSIGQLSGSLIEVLFLKNQLSGCLPYEIGLLKKATVFDVGFNWLTGPIPHSFQCLEKMELLNLARNNFYGAVPEAVCCLPRLKNFSLSYNYFTQVGPQCRKLIKDGVLDVRMNCILDLPMQRSPKDCANFFLMTRYCPDEKSLSIVPCKKYLAGSLESSDIQSSAPAPALAPQSRTYDALSP